MPQIKDALINADAEATQKAVEEMIESKINEVNAQIQELQSMGIDVHNDDAVMIARGKALLTKEETKYYNAVIEKTSFDEIEETFPITVFDRVFEDLKKNRPLLSKIQFRNTTGITEWLIRTKDVQAAWWGPICGPIKKQIEQGFKKIRMDQKKLSAFLPICKSMLILSPAWLDTLITTMLYESLLEGIEDAAINGSGVNQPIGMIKDMTTPLVTEPAGDGDKEPAGYGEKTPVPITDLTPKTLGKILSKFVDGKAMNQPTLDIIINPTDYYEKIFANTIHQTPEGKYIYDNIAVAIDFIQSDKVEKGKAIIGRLDKYFFGIASPSRIEYSDHFRFLEDDRVYIAKLLANGRPESNTDFMVLDISGMNA